VVSAVELANLAWQKVVKIEVQQLTVLLSFHLSFLKTII